MAVLRQVGVMNAVERMSERASAGHEEFIVVVPNEGNTKLTLVRRRRLSGLFRRGMSPSHNTGRRNAPDLRGGPRYAGGGGGGDSVSHGCHEWGKNSEERNKMNEMMSSNDLGGKALVPLSREMACFYFDHLP